MKKRTSGRDRATRAAARMKSSCPFPATSRPTVPTTGVSASSPNSARQAPAFALARYAAASIPECTMSMCDLDQWKIDVTRAATGCDTAATRVGRTKRNDRSKCDPSVYKSRA